MDPTDEEESLSTARITVVTEEGDRLCAVHKPGQRTDAGSFNHLKVLCSFSLAQSKPSGGRVAHVFHLFLPVESYCAQVELQQSVLFQIKSIESQETLKQPWIPMFPRIRWGVAVGKEAARVHQQSHSATERDPETHRQSPQQCENIIIICLRRTRFI